MLQELEIDLDLTAVFCLKKSEACSSDTSLIEHIQDYKYYWKSNAFLKCWV